MRSTPEPSQAIVVDLHTGKQTDVHRRRLPPLHAPRRQGPAGEPCRRRAPSPSSLERVDLAGKPQLTYPTDKLENQFNGRYLSTPDGTRLVLGTSAGLSLMGNDGVRGPTLPIPGQSDCSPVRWWDGAPETTVLANCTSSDSWYTSSLWLVPIDGGTPTALTAPNNGKNGGRDLATSTPGSCRRARSFRPLAGAA